MTATILKCTLAGLLAVTFAGCQSTGTNEPSAVVAPRQVEYIDIEYRKLVAGVFVDDLKDKFIKLRCRFVLASAGQVPRGYNPDKWLAFSVGSPLATDMPAYTTVVIPKQMAESVLALNAGDQVEVRGQARIVVVGSRLVGILHKSLMIQADSIEKK